MLPHKITNYTILKCDKECDLERIVLHYMQDGWQPLGGVAVCLSASSSTYKSDKEYYQAMVKYEQPKQNQV